MIKVFTSRITYDGLLIEGEEPSELLGLQGSHGVISVSPIKYSLKIMPINNGYIATGSAESLFEFECDKCLVHYTQILRAPDICHLYENAQAYEIDLTEDIREDILILLPTRFLCSDLCKGICFKCGRNLNSGKCSCHNSEKNDSVWTELNNLKI